MVHRPTAHVYTLNHVKHEREMGGTLATKVEERNVQKNEDVRRRALRAESSFENEGSKLSNHSR